MVEVNGTPGVIRRIFDYFVAGSYSIRRICRLLYEEGIPSPTGRETWKIPTISQMLRNPTYKGKAFYNRHQAVPPTSGRKSTRNKLRPPEEWVEIPVPAIVSEELFEAAQRVSRDHSYFSPRRNRPDEWLLRRLVVCGREEPLPGHQEPGWYPGSSAITCATEGAHSKLAAQTGPAHNRRSEPESWTRWCGNKSMRPWSGPPSW